jgi:hypothetical protein
MRLLMFRLGIVAASALVAFSGGAWKWDSLPH